MSTAVLPRIASGESEKVSTLSHMPQLDGLRALAVTAVVVHHYLPHGWLFGGQSAVRLFFTLSGFLITGILLRSRESAESSQQSRSKTLLKFYARRVLRIFPLYY